NQIYDLVWTESVRSVARRHGISDVALAKACRKMRIPIPRRGYWARVAAGQKVKRPSLPTLRPGDPSEYRLSRLNQNSLAPEIAAALRKEAATEDRIQVAGELVSPHPLVETASTVLAKAKPNKEGLILRQDRRCLDIQVSPALVGRALRIMDALLKALEQRGYKVDASVPRHEEKRDYYGRVEQIHQ